MPTRARIPIAPLLAGLIIGCGAFREPVVPMPTLDLARGGGSCLAILLPGRWDRPQSFVEAGFANLVRERGLPLDWELARQKARELQRPTGRNEIDALLCFIGRLRLVSGPFSSERRLFHAP